MMNEKDLKKLHELLVMLSEEVKRICNENGIKYSLTGGSMIGAVRHKGFIPWDDDMDIAMLREDYNKFLKACETQLGPEFEIQTLDTDPNYFFGFAKIMLKDTYLLQYCHERTKHKKGIFVDIFPLDNVPENINSQRKQKRQVHLLLKMLARKGKAGIEDRGNILKVIAFHIIDIIDVFFSMEYLKKKLTENMTKFNGQKTELVCNMSGYYSYEKETTYRRYFENTVTVSFEDTEFAIIKEYDNYLKSVYGDYMKLPPKEKRRTHGFKCLDFGPYKD